MKKKGFSMMEMLVVVLIIGILAAIVIPSYKKAVFRSYLVQGLPLAKQIAAEAEVFYMTNGRWPYIGELGVEEKETQHYSVYCANAESEGESSETNCGIVAVSGKDLYYGSMVTIFISNLPEKAFTGASWGNYKHVCGADQYAPIAAFTKSIFLSFGVEPISDMLYGF